jgi:hypothetical protein
LRYQLRFVTVVAQLDPDDHSTWPPEVVERVAMLDASVPETECVSDLETADFAESEVRSLIAGRRVIAYHATRLLPHEVDGIRAGGLPPFSRELFDERIRLAYDAGAIDQPARDRLLVSHMYAVGEAHRRGRREGQVCVTLGRASFEEVSGVRPLLSTWGGEGIYYSSGAVDAQDLLRSLGRPAVIQLRIPVATDWMHQPCFPSMDRILLGSYDAW